MPQQGGKGERIGNSLPHLGKTPSRPLNNSLIVINPNTGLINPVRVETTMAHPKYKSTFHGGITLRGFNNPGGKKRIEIVPFLLLPRGTYSMVFPGGADERAAYHLEVQVEGKTHVLQPIPVDMEYNHDDIITIDFRKISTRRRSRPDRYHIDALSVDAKNPNLDSVSFRFVNQ